MKQQNKLLLEKYQTEKQEHQKDKELVLHKYLTATQIKSIFSSHVVYDNSKVPPTENIVKYITEENDTLPYETVKIFKSFTNLKNRVNIIL